MEQPDEHGGGDVDEDGYEGSARQRRRRRRAAAVAAVVTAAMVLPMLVATINAIRR